MPDIYTVGVSADHRIPVGVPGAAVTVANAGGDTLYYGDQAQVSSTSNTGNLTAGQSVILATPVVWLISASYSTVTITSNPGAGVVSPYDKDNGQAGMYAIPQPLIPTAAGWTPVANAVRGVRIKPSRDINMIKAEVVIQTIASTNDSIDFGVYANNGLNNNITLLANMGATAGIANSSVQVHNLPLVYTLKAGQIYYLALGYGAVGGTAATFASIGSAAAEIFSTQVFGPRFPVAEIFAGTGGIPLAASVGYVAATVAPLLILREN